MADCSILTVLAAASAFTRWIVPAAVLASSAHLHPVLAQSPSQPDLASITIKGVIFHLPSSGIDAQNVKIDPLPPSLSRPGLSIADIVKAPDEAQRKFSEWGSIGITLPSFPFVWSGLFLGRFVRDRTLPRIFDAIVGTGATDRCISDDQHWQQYRTRARSGENLAADGWAEFVETQIPQRWVYVRSNPDLSRPKNFDTFVCDYAGFCRASFCVAGVRFGYNFFATERFRLKGNILPTAREQWPQIVRNAADVVRLIVGDDLWNAELVK